MLKKISEKNKWAGIFFIVSILTALRFFSIDKPTPLNPFEWESYYMLIGISIGSLIGFLLAYFDVFDVWTQSSKDKPRDTLK